MLNWEPIIKNKCLLLHQLKKKVLQPMVVVIMTWCPHLRHHGKMVASLRIWSNQLYCYTSSHCWISFSWIYLNKRKQSNPYYTINWSNIFKKAKRKEKMVKLIQSIKYIIIRRAKIRIKTSSSLDSLKDESDTENTTWSFPFYIRLLNVN